MVTSSESPGFAIPGIVTLIVISAEDPEGTAMDEMKSGNFDGAVKQKATGHDSDYKSIGSFKNQKGITVHGYQSKGTGKKIFKGEKQGNFSSAQESDFNAAKKYQEFQASKGK